MQFYSVVKDQVKGLCSPTKQAPNELFGLGAYRQAYELSIKPIITLWGPLLSLMQAFENVTNSERQSMDFKKHKV